MAAVVLVAVVVTAFWHACTAGHGQPVVWSPQRCDRAAARPARIFHDLGTRPNISETHSEISTRVPLCIAAADGYAYTTTSVKIYPIREVWGVLL